MSARVTSLAVIVIGALGLVISGAAAQTPRRLAFNVPLCNEAMSPLLVGKP